MKKNELSNAMENKSRYQIVISGVGGQGVLFITRLLAEAAIDKNLPVFTSETHGMAQRGGTVISHLKVGDFASPLINPGRADGLIALKAESLAQHGGYLRADAWAAVNSPSAVDLQAPSRVFEIDADRLARETGDTRSLNLIMLGFTLARAPQGGVNRAMLYFSLDDIKTVLEKRLKGKGRRLQFSLRALMVGAEAAAA
jgi:indolepyruvate ferredoxin oxidoreductase beta subunit